MKNIQKTLTKMVENIILLESIIEFRVFEDLRLKVYFENNSFVGAGGKVVFWAEARRKKCSDRSILV